MGAELVTHCASKRYVVASVIAVGAWLGSVPVHASTSTIGRTWTIAEPDALSEIESCASHVPDMAQAFGPRSRWSAMKAAALRDATRSQVREIVPFYTLDREIRLPDGKLLYAKGYTFNPLAYVSLPQRLIIVQPRDLAWALQDAKPADLILLAAAGTYEPSSADPIALGERYGRPLFLLEERVKTRLGLTVAPVIVRQIGQRLELAEIGPMERRSLQERAR